MTDYDALEKRLGKMCDTSGRHEFDIGDYWNVCEEVAAAIRELRADAERLNWLEKQTNSCPGLINDDCGRWAYSEEGAQNVPNNEKPIDIQTTFFVEAAGWHESVRAAIDAAMKEKP